LHADGFRGPISPMDASSAWGRGSGLLGFQVRLKVVRPRWPAAAWKS